MSTTVHSPLWPIGSSLGAFSPSLPVSSRAWPSVCIIGGGKAEQALVALLPHCSYARTTMYCPFQDEADPMNADLAEQGGSCTETSRSRQAKAQGRSFGRMSSSPDARTPDVERSSSGLSST